MKPFKNLVEQIELLEQRGLKINNTGKAKHYLLQHSYYNIINVYSKFFQETSNVYISQSTFEEIRSVHIFDTEIKSVLFRSLIECEKHFKSILSHRFSEYYKNIPYAYLKTTSYNSDGLLKITNTISRLSQTITDNLRDKKPNAIKHHNANHQDVPLWVLINHLTFGQVLHMYIHLEDKLKNIIAKDISAYLEDNIHVQVTLEPKEIERVVFNLIDIRNCVAHNNKLFDLKCRNSMKYFLEIHGVHNIQKRDSRQDTFNVILSMQCLLEESQYALLHNTLLKRAKTLDRKLNSIPIDKVLGSLGFPKDWINNAQKIPQ